MSADSVVTCTLDELPAVMEAAAAAMVDQYRERLTDAVAYVTTEIAAEAPRQSGAFAGSVQAYVGPDPPATWQEGGGSPQSAAEVEAVMEDWKPGDECGAATDAPYSRKLVFFAGHYTKRVPPGWVDAIVAQANQRLAG